MRRPPVASRGAGRHTSCGCRVCEFRPFGQVFWDTSVGHKPVLVRKAYTSKTSTLLGRGIPSSHRHRRRNGRTSLVLPKGRGIQTRGDTVLVLDSAQPEKWYSVKEVAAILGFSEDTVIRQV